MSKSLSHQIVPISPYYLPKTYRNKNQQVCVLLLYYHFLNSYVSSVLDPMDIKIKTKDISSCSWISLHWKLFTNKECLQIGVQHSNGSYLKLKSYWWTLRLDMWSSTFIFVTNSALTTKIFSMIESLFWNKYRLKDLSLFTLIFWAAVNRCGHVIPIPRAQRYRVQLQYYQMSVFYNVLNFQKYKTIWQKFSLKTFYAHNFRNFKWGIRD